MAKILVLYYSMYGHIETMAHAVAEGAKKVDGAEVIIKRVPETMPPEIFAKLAVKRKRTGCHPTGAGGLRCHYFWYANPVWQYVRPDAYLPRPNRRTVGIRRAIRQARQRVQFYRNGRRPSRRSPRLDYACPSWDGDCPDRLCRTGTV